MSLDGSVNRVTNKASFVELNSKMVLARGVDVPIPTSSFSVPLYIRPSADPL